MGFNAIGITNFNITKIPISVGFRKVRTFSKNFEDNFRKIKFRKKKLRKNNFRNYIFRKLKFVLIFSKNFEKVRIISNFN